jgi:transposase
VTCIHKKKEEGGNDKNSSKHPAIMTIPDELWNEFKKILPKEKPSNTVGRPMMKYRKVLDGILYVLRTGCQWKMIPKVYGSGSTCHRRFQEWNILGVFKNTWVKLLKIYDKEIGINWTWQSLDSISVKLPLGGPRQETILLIGANWAQKDIF